MNDFGKVFYIIFSAGLIYNCIRMTIWKMTGGGR